MISKKFEKKVKYKSLSITIGMITIVLPILFVLLFLFYSLLNALPSLIKVVNVHSIMKYIPFKVPTDIITDLTHRVVEFVFVYLLELVRSLPTLSIHLLVFIMSTFYLARDGTKLIQYIRSILPKNKVKLFNKMLREIEVTIRAIFYGHFLAALIVGIFATMAYYILGYPFPAILGVITMFTTVIPVIGPWPVYLSLGIYDIIHGNVIRGVAIIVFGKSLGFLDVYLRTELGGKYAEIHPMLFLVGFIGGPMIWGIAGFILGPLILCTTHTIIKTYKSIET